jgi:1-phosphofructokinase family hexose kinase
VAALVISLNPAVDCEWRVKAVLPEEKNEILEEVRWPGGKGINVARWLTWLAEPNRLFLPLGGDTGRELAQGLRAEGLTFSRFPLKEPNRVNVVVTQESGPQFRFNQTRPQLDRATSRRLVARAAELAGRGDPVVISGTLAFGAPAESYAQIAATARRARRRVFLDCDREPFNRALQESPFLVKPNEFELAQWAGRKLSSLEAVARAAAELSRVTGGYVLVSRAGSGALLVSEKAGIQLSAGVPAVNVRNTVGAGDAMLAGAIAASNRSDQPAKWLRWAIATGCAATEVPPGKLPTRRRWQQLLREVPLVSF